MLLLSKQAHRYNLNLSFSSIINHSKNTNEIIYYTRLKNKFTTPLDILFNELMSHKELKINLLKDFIIDYKKNEFTDCYKANSYLNQIFIQFNLFPYSSSFESQEQYSLIGNMLELKYKNSVSLN